MGLIDKLRQVARLEAESASMAVRSLETRLADLEAATREALAAEEKAAREVPTHSFSSATAIEKARQAHADAKARREALARQAETVRRELAAANTVFSKARAAADAEPEVEYASVAELEAAIAAATSERRRLVEDEERARREADRAWRETDDHSAEDRRLGEARERRIRVGDDVERLARRLDAARRAEALAHAAAQPDRGPSAEDLAARTAALEAEAERLEGERRTMALRAAELGDAVDRGPADLADPLGAAAELADLRRERDSARQVVERIDEELARVRQEMADVGDAGAELARKAARAEAERLLPEVQRLTRELRAVLAPYCTARDRATSRLWLLSASSEKDLAAACERALVAWAKARPDLAAKD